MFQLLDQEHHSRSQSLQLASSRCRLNEGAVLRMLSLHVTPNLDKMASNFPLYPFTSMISSNLSSRYNRSKMYFWIDHTKVCKTLLLLQLTFGYRYAGLYYWWYYFFDFLSNLSGTICFFSVIIFLQLAQADIGGKLSRGTEFSFRPRGTVICGEWRLLRGAMSCTLHLSLINQCIMWRLKLFN